MSTNPFPYNSTVQGITLTTGSCAGTTLVISAYANGITAGQIQPLSPRSISNSIAILGKLLASGSSTTALSFLFDPSGNQEPPYYFLLGSEGTNLFLYSITPATTYDSEGNLDFNADNVSSLGEITQPIDAAITDILFYPPTNRLFITSSNGNIYGFSVSCNSDGSPNITYEWANKIYSSSTSGGIVTMALAYLTPNNPNVIVSGLTKGETSASFYFPVSSMNTSATDYLWYTVNSLATVVDQTNQIVYTATPNSVFAHSFDNLQTQPRTIWNPDSQLIMSLAGSLEPLIIGSLSDESAIENTSNGGFYIYDPQSKSADSLSYKNIDLKQYSQGTLFIGTASTASSITDTSNGSIYNYYPQSKEVSVFQDGNLPVPPYSICADDNLHLLVNGGSTGLYYYTIAYKPPIPESSVLIPNGTASSSQSSPGTLESLIEFKF